MSISLMTEAWRLDLPATDKMVLLALADAANDDGVTWIALKSRRAGKLDLATKTSLSERAIQGAIKRLCDGGYLSRKENPGRGVWYHVTPAGDAPPQDMRPAAGAPTPAGDAGKPSITVTNKKSARELSDDWKPEDFGSETKAAKVIAGWSSDEMEIQLESFRAHHGKTAGKFVDWQKAWQTWVLNSRNFTRPDRKAVPERPAPDPAKWTAERRAAYARAMDSPEDPASRARGARSIGDLTAHIGR